MINKATILGKIEKKEYRPTRNGKPVCNLSVLTSKSFNDSTGKKQETTTQHHINLFDKLAEIANMHASVGDLVFIDGEIINKKIDDNGTIRIMPSITADKIRVFKRKNKKIPDNIGNLINDFDNNEAIF